MYEALEDISASPVFAKVDGEVHKLPYEKISPLTEHADEINDTYFTTATRDYGIPHNHAVILSLAINGMKDNMTQGKQFSQKLDLAT